MDIFDSIQECPKVRYCWGDRNPPAYGPVVVPSKKSHPKVIVITEQPNLRRGSAQPWDPTGRFPICHDAPIPIWYQA